MENKLAFDPQEFRAAAGAVLDWVCDYYAGLAGRPVLKPTSSGELRARLDEPLPQGGTPFGELLATFGSVIAEYSRHNGHPRFFGYIASPGTPVTALASLLEATLNVNLTSWRSAPAAAEIEHLVIRWFQEMLGYPREAGILTSGGSMANFAALAAARDSRKGRVVYVSSEGHYSVAKAARLLAIETREIPVDGDLRIDLAALEHAIAADAAPLAIVANAGSTATGAFDPIESLVEIARRHQLWLHVDAAYGGFAALAPSVRPRFHGIEAADSVTLDPHKWMFAPAGCGCVLYRDPAAARAAFSHDAEYTRTIGLVRDEAFAFWDYGPELTRPFRALELWMQIKFAGAAQLGEAIERNMACARYFEQLVNASDDFEMACPVGLSVFCFRKKGESDAGHEQILVNLQREGSSYLSNARVGGRFALRGCVVNHRTTERDMEILLEDVRRATRTRGEPAR
jgi:aromatic-L-amino-acid decarboxylase